ncbi:MAG: hypothetical protein BWK73_39050 [Thiothrix lacustris]|uniref:Uncharacterized protein n=1 Tax=Thiothrix lacustris TaxID=525917 RepID=A0A1Y1QEI9_9GAMM|nr:MAG: hypothetical protein BWK73_39050 [Thiothrix lacustris]
MFSSKQDIISGFSKYFLFGVMIVAVLGSVYPMKLTANQEIGFSGATGVLSAIFIIVLLVERTTELIIRYRRNAGKEDLKHQIVLLTQQKENVPAEQQLVIETRLQQLKMDLFSYQNITMREAWFLSFCISVLICIAGVGILGELFELNRECVVNNGFDFITLRAQIFIFRLVDIVLTASLISGGTNIFHQLLKAAEEFSTQLRAKK